MASTSLRFLTWTSSLAGTGLPSMLAIRSRLRGSAEKRCSSSSFVTKVTPARIRIRVIEITAATLTPALRQKLCQALLSAKSRCLKSLMVSPGPVVPDHLAVFDHDHPPAQEVDYLAVVGRHHHGGAVGVDLENELHDLPRRGRVEGAGRRVGDHQQRGVHARAGT